MTLLSYLVIIFGYIAILVFVFGLAYRIWRWQRRPLGVFWGLYPKPTKWIVTSLIWRALAWPNLFATDKLLWVVAALFHIAILLLFIGHWGVFFDLASFMEKMIGIPPKVALAIGVYAGLIAGIMLLFFIGRRIFIRRVSEISNFSDHFWLWFLLIVVGVGMYSRVFVGVDAKEVWKFTTSFITLKPILPPQQVWFLIHVLLAELFIIYFIASKFIHFIGQFFTQYVVVSRG